MTRAWDSHTRTALGVKAHTDHLARGPSKSWVVAQILKTGATNTVFSLDARLYAGIQSMGTNDYTGGTCFIDIGSCGSAPTVDYSHAETGIRTWTIDTPYVDSFPDQIDTEFDTDTSGLWRYKDETGSPRCYGFYRMNTAPEFGFGLRVPRDTSETIRYFVCYAKAAAEADRVTGGLPSCSTGWSVAPPAGVTYSLSSATLATCYQVYRRASEGAVWEPVGDPWDRWPNAATYGYYRPNQTTSTMWAKTGANEIKVWDLETSYNAASKTTITLPGGNVNWIAAWGSITFVGSTNGNIYVYDGTTYAGAIGSPLNTATWDWAYIGWGWLALTQDGTVHFWQINATGLPTFYQTLEPSDDTVGAYVTVELHAPDHGTSGTWHGVYFDHRDVTWKYGGSRAHVKALVDDGWSWLDTLHRHLILYRETVGDSSRWDYRYVQVF